jgi:hypothetical protein
MKPARVISRGLFFARWYQKKKPERLPWHLDHCFKRHVRRHRQFVAWRQVAIDIETPVARRPGMFSSAAGDTKGHTARICRCADTRIGL